MVHYFVTILMSLIHCNILIAMTFIMGKMQKQLQKKKKKNPILPTTEKQPGYSTLIKITKSTNYMNWLSLTLT